MSAVSCSLQGCLFPLILSFIHCHFPPFTQKSFHPQRILSQRSLGTVRPIYGQVQKVHFQRWSRNGFAESISSSSTRDKTDPLVLEGRLGARSWNRRGRHQQRSLKNTPCWSEQPTHSSTMVMCQHIIDSTVPQGGPSTIWAPFVTSLSH